MTWSEDAAEALADAGVDLVAYLPDSKMDALISEVVEDDRFETVLVSREEEAVGVLVGAWVGGDRGALLCQSSGLANTFNAIGQAIQQDPELMQRVQEMAKAGGAGADQAS